MGWGDVIGGIAGIGGTIWSGVQGQQSLNLAEDMAESQKEILEQQLKAIKMQLGITEEQWAVYKPYFEAQIASQLQDLQSWDPYKQQYAQMMLGDLGSEGQLRDLQYGNALETQRMIGDYYRPMERSMIEEANRAGDEGAARRRAASDVTQAYKGSMDTLSRDLTRRGLRTDSGAFALSAREMAFDRARKLSDAKNKAARQARDEGWNKKSSLMNLSQGKGMDTQISSNGGMGLTVPQGSAGQPQSYSSVASGFGDVANGYGSLAQLAGNAAGHSSQAMMYGLGRMFQTPQRGGVNWDDAWNTVSGLFPEQQ